ncbi:unnamed protein product, partial [Prorocentrum cordatum]
SGEPERCAPSVPGTADLRLRRFAAREAGGKTDRTGGEAEGRGLYPWGRRTCEPPSIATKSSRRSDADVHGPSVRVGVDALDHRADLLQRAPPRRSPEPRARSWHRWIDATEP